MRTVTVSNVSLFRVAARELGDAAQWWRIARVNKLSDPEIGPVTTLLIPARFPAAGDGLPAEEPTQE